MFNVIIESISGLICGLILGITGYAPTSLVLYILTFFQIGSFKSDIGSLLFINLFPISIGSIMQFYKAKQINYSISFVLLITTIIGSYLGTKIILDKKYSISEQTIKYIISFVSFLIGFIYLL
jgi:uncharacterized membrane protein YfcA